MLRASLALLLVAATAHADATPPTPGALPVTVKLVEKKKLRLVRMPPSKKVGLDGVIEATVTNTGSATVRLRNLEVHGVLFTNRKGGATHVVVHSCKCVQDVAEPAKSVTVLAPGASASVFVDDWGCGGGLWDAPEPGSWEMTYRVVGAPDALPAAQPEASPPEVTRQCRESYRSEAFWKGAVSSVPLALTLQRAVAIKAR